jgi:hypothetical protein
MRFIVARLTKGMLTTLPLLTLSLSPGVAEYGPKTTIGTYYQQTSDTYSTDGVTANPCLAVGACHILFQQVPLQQKLIITHLSCYVHTTTGQVYRAMLHSRTGSGGLPFRNTSIAAAQTSTNEFVANGPVLHLLEANQRPVVLLQSTLSPNFGLGHCTISGTLVAAG